MLYHVRMDVRPPHDIDPERFERLKTEERAVADCRPLLEYQHLRCRKPR